MLTGLPGGDIGPLHDVQELFHVFLTLRIALLEGRVSQNQGLREWVLRILLGLLLLLMVVELGVWRGSILSGRRLFV